MADRGDTKLAKPLQALGCGATKLERHDVRGAREIEGRRELQIKAACRQAWGGYRSAADAGEIGAATKATAQFAVPSTMARRAARDVIVDIA